MRLDLLCVSSRGDKEEERTGRTQHMLMGVGRLTSKKPTEMVTLRETPKRSGS